MKVIFVNLTHWKEDFRLNVANKLFSQLLVNCWIILLDLWVVLNVQITNISDPTRLNHGYLCSASSV